MAKTLMIKNEIYEELKREKHDRSFSDLISDLLKNNRKKTGDDLKKCLGLLKKDDSEYNEIMEWLRPMYKKWSKRYC